MSIEKTGVELKAGQGSIDAIGLLRQHVDKSYPFCDAISFVVMQRLGTKRVAAYDDHFRQFGEFEQV